MGKTEQVAALNKLQDAVVARHERALTDLISAAMLYAADNLTNAREVVLPDTYASDVTEALRALYEDITVQMGDAIIDQFKEGFPHLLERKDNLPFYRRVWEGFLASFGLRRVLQITETTRRQLQQTVQEGLNVGDSVDDIARAIRLRAPKFSALRSAVISRTETHSAALYASTEVAKTSEVPLLKEWVSIEDSRTRDFGEGDAIIDEFNHRKMDGVQVPLDQPFRVPTKFGLTENLMFPGDPAGSPGNIINCRCSQVYERVK